MGASKVKRLRVLRGLVSASDVEDILRLSRKTDFDSTEPFGNPVVTPHRALARNGRWKCGVLASNVRVLVQDRLLPYMCAELNCNDLVASQVIIRRYAPEQRRSHAVHFDFHALGTAIIDLTPRPGSGLVVGLDASALSHFFAPFDSPGDAVVHGWDLAHGVELEAGHERVSLVIWVKPRADVESETATPSWYHSAAEQGDPDASFRLSFDAEAAGNLALARDYLNHAASQGHVQAMVSLSALLTKLGWIERRPQRSTEAREWLERAAQANFADAQVNLADALRREDDPGATQRSLQLYEKAAEQRDTRAMLRLSDAFADGLGVQKDEGQSVRFLHDAAKWGSSDAQFALAKRAKFSGEDARTWLRAASSHGHAGALLMLSMLEEQDGRRGEAKRFYDAAMASDHPDAAAQLAACDDIH